MGDFIYGQLNKCLAGLDYAGITTDTVEVIVDNSKRTIAANIRPLASEFLKEFILQGLQGKPGKDGLNGRDGKSAYEIWLNSGYVGTEAEFLDWLKGRDGINGTNGIDGVGIKQVIVTPSIIDEEDNPTYDVEVLLTDNSTLNVGRFVVPRGEIGPEGPRGLQGLQGPPGRDGRDGRNGVDGRDGLNGRDGIDGQDGQNGKDGIDALVCYAPVVLDSSTSSILHLRKIDFNRAPRLSDEFITTAKLFSDNTTSYLAALSISEEPASLDSEGSWQLAVNVKSLQSLGNPVKYVTIDVNGIPPTATQGDFLKENLDILQESDLNYIMFNHEKYYLQDRGHKENYITYTHVGFENSAFNFKAITITIDKSTGSGTWVLNVASIPGTVAP